MPKCIFDYNNIKHLFSITPSYFFPFWFNFSYNIREISNLDDIEALL